MSSGRERIHHTTPSERNKIGLNRSARSCAARTSGFIGDWGPLVVERIHVSGVEAEEIVASKRVGGENWRVLSSGDAFAERNPKPVHEHGADANLLKTHSDLCENDKIVPPSDAILLPSSRFWHS